MKEFPEMMTPQQAADFLQCTRANVYERLRRGTLPGLRVGHEWRVPKSELIALARANMDKARHKQAAPHD
jgi:excisionase family DNA binding protein